MYFFFSNLLYNWHCSLVEPASEDFEEEATKDDKGKNNYVRLAYGRLQICPGIENILNQKGDTGDLRTAFFSFFLIAFSGLPIRASCSRANLALRRRCSSVCAFTTNQRFRSRRRLPVRGRDHVNATASTATCRLTYHCVFL